MTKIQNLAALNSEATIAQNASTVIRNERYLTKPYEPSPAAIHEAMIAAGIVIWKSKTLRPGRTGKHDISSATDPTLRNENTVDDGVGKAPGFADP
jgi:hypothetical protein